MTVTFVTNGGTSVTKLENVEELPTPLPTTTKANNIFVGWFYDSGFEEQAYSGDELTTNVTLYAKWYANMEDFYKDVADAIRSKNGETEPIKHTDFAYKIKTLPLSTTYMVRFYDFQGTGNTLLEAETVISGGNATAPADPVRTGYQFTGWSPSYTNITTNTDIYGQWVEAGPPANVVRFVSAEARTIIPNYTNSGVTLQYSVDSGSTWTTIASGESTTSATEHWFRGQATGTKSLFTSSYSSNAWEFNGSSDLEVYGNLNYLLCDALGDEEAPTSLGDYAYAYMFGGCTSLTTAPELPATTLATWCYARMFNGCTSLTTAPALPATILGEYCYSYMFYNCTSLITAPELPATTLANNCYNQMFYNCTSFKVSATYTGSYTYAWRIPTSGTGTSATDWNLYMLKYTGGTFTSNPTINKTYYVENEPV